MGISEKKGELTLKSNSMMKHFHTLQEQRAHYLPSIHALTLTERAMVSQRGGKMVYW